jgi:hypothetical protein
MKEYYRDDMQVCVDFSAHIEILEAQFGQGSATLSSNYDARIVNNHRKPEYINFIIYYTPAEYLFEKFQYLKEKGIDIFQCITNRPTQRNWDHPNLLDFTNSRLINIEESHHWEHDKKPLLLTIDNFDILVDGRYLGDGRFQLTENAHQHIDEYIHYGQLANHDPSDQFISINNNREVSLGNIRLILSFNHDYGDGTKFKLEINRDAYLTITDESNSLTDIELIEKGNLICTLMSLYWEKTIDFFIAYVRVNNKKYYRTLKKYKYSNHATYENIEFSLKSRYETVYDFFESLDSTKIIDCRNLLTEIIPRIIKTKIVDEISEFMLLYNVIEKIRNYCLINPIKGDKLVLREEFRFTLGSTATKKFISNKIKEIHEIVDESDIDDFLAKASDKVTFIRKTGLIDQFDSLVTYLELDPKLYSLDFISLITIRSNIYHGKAPQEDVKPYNSKMRLLINDLLLRLIQ